jgi:peptidoglycan/LPS O-acetylase OafA/YrhL
MRRVLRIFPLYYLVLIFGFLYYHLLLPAFGFEHENNYNLWHGILLGGTFFSNIFSVSTPGGILEVLWSIGIEEQFYLFIAPILLLLAINWIRPFLALFTILYFMIYAFTELIPIQKYSMFYYYFSASGLLSVLTLKLRPHRYQNYIDYLLYLVFILYFTTSFFRDNLPEAPYQFFSMVLFTLVITALVRKPYTFLENKHLDYLGKISYGLYMLHPIVMQLIGFFYLKMALPVTENYILQVVGFNLAVILLTILLAHLSYKYFESYFLRLKKR